MEDAAHPQVSAKQLRLPCFVGIRGQRSNQPCQFVFQLNCPLILHVVSSLEPA